MDPSTVSSVVTLLGSTSPAEKAIAVVAIVCVVLNVILQPKSDAASDALAVSRPMYFRALKMFGAMTMNIPSFLVHAAGMVSARKEAKMVAAASERAGNSKVPPPSPPSMGGGALAFIVVALVGALAIGGTTTACTRMEANSALAIGAAAMACVRDEVGAGDEEPGKIAAKCFGAIAGDVLELALAFINGEIGARRAAAHPDVTGVHMNDGGVITIDDAGAPLPTGYRDAYAPDGGAH